MKRFLSIIDGLSEWTAKLCSFLVVVVTIVVVFEVVMRYAFNAPTIWGLELTIYLSCVTYLIGGAYIHSLREHVRVDIIYKQFTLRTRAILDLFTFLLILTVFSVITWFGVKWAWLALIGGTTSGSIWSPIIWPMRLIIPLSAFLMVLQGLAMFIRDLNIAVRGKEQ